MIESNAQDYSGLQEIPEHRIGPEYRFSVVKKLARQNNIIYLANTTCTPINENIEENEKVTVFKQNYTLSKEILNDGSLWYKIVQG
jgi:hypothetical protein